MPAILRQRPYRHAVPAWLLGVLAGVYLLAVCNRQLWHEVVASFAASGGMAAHPGLVSTLVLRLCGNLALTLALVLWPRIGKWLLALLLLVAASSAFYIDRFGVRLDQDVVQSIFETTRAEASALVTPASVTWIGLFGILPAIVVLMLPVRFPPLRRALLGRAAVIAAAAVAMLLPAKLAGRDWVYFYRNHRFIYDVFNPYAGLSGTFHYLQRNVFHRERALVAVGTDAKLAPAAPDARRRVLVLVVGETARAQNQSLGGYARDTNPQMRRLGAVYFTDAWSCGTATTVSVPCMFSGMGRERFDKPVAMARWNLLDIVQHAGVDVFWRDNDEGCKGVCARVPNQDLTKSRVANLCDASGCLDQVLLEDLPRRLAAMHSPALVVLHIKGSHGPAYYQRYPPDFRRFNPACDTAEVQTCTYAQVVASYDNSILYTDHILGKVADMLGALPDTDGALFYLSDHGESLGEHGIYLHGMDWSRAPAEQKHIPMLLWFTPGWLRNAGLDASCLDRRRVQSASQDNVFHTVLGMLGVRTVLYQPGLDLVAGCRRAPDAAGG